MYKHIEKEMLTETVSVLSSQNARKDTALLLHTPLQFTLLLLHKVKESKLTFKQLNIGLFKNSQSTQQWQLSKMQYCEQLLMFIDIDFFFNLTVCKDQA